MSETKQQLQFLTTVDLSGNKLVKLRPLLSRKLVDVIFDNNQINELDFSSKGHDTITRMSLNGNQLCDLKGLMNLRAMEELSMNNNQVKTLEGI